MTGVCLTIYMDSFRHHSDITNGRNIDLIGADSNSENLWQGGGSDRQTCSPSECFGSALGHIIHSDTCIIMYNGIIVFMIPK